MNSKPASTLAYGLCLSLLLAAPRVVQARDTNEMGREETARKRVFTFEGGSPVDFIAALDRHFRTRLAQILTLPEVLSRTKVPKLRVAADDPREVLSLYNRLQSPTLGQWRFEPNGAAPNPSATNMNVLMLESEAAAKMERAGAKVKGVALAGVPEEKWDALLRDIDEAGKHGETIAKGAGELFTGSIRLQRESRILIVAGPDAYIQMVESLVTAHRMNAEIDAKSASVPKAAEAAVK